MTNLQHYSNETAEFLEQGADYIDKYGWHQGDYFPGAGSMNIDTDEMHTILSTQHYPACAMGSLIAVAGGNFFEYVDVGEALKDYLQTAVPIFNDTVGRTKEEVTEAMRRAALEIRAGNIGDDQREYEFEPFPETAPVKEPSVPTPAPAPAEPEKVPA